jgi:hypothetical protein
MWQSQTVVDEIASSMTPRNDIKRNVAKVGVLRDNRIMTTKQKAVTVTFSLFSILLLAAIGFLLYKISQMDKELALARQSPGTYTDMQNKTVIEKLGQIVILPTDEEPSIATILDKEKLKDNPFFVKAKNGDKIIAYENNRLIYLYRPEINKLVGLLPFIIGDSSQSAEIKKATPSAKPTLKPTATSPVPTNN